VLTGMYRTFAECRGIWVYSTFWSGVFVQAGGLHGRCGAAGRGGA
jgi:hypothetical protein